MKTLSVKDYKDILAVVNLYVESRKQGNADIMRPAFDKQAVIFSYTPEGKLVAEEKIEHLFESFKGMSPEHESIW